MADGLLHDPTATGALSAVGTATLAWLGQRLVGKAAIQEAINKSFHELMEQLRQELRVALKERDEARAESADQRVTIEALHRTISALEQRLVPSR